MRRFVSLGGCGLLGLALVAFLASPAAAAKNANTAEEVAVLMKWYHNYFQEGKYEQAEHVAELAYELAPDDPEARVALKVARRQLNRSSSTSNDQNLVRVLTKIDTLEKHLSDLQAERQRLQQQLAVLKAAKTAPSRVPHREPPGSPDGVE